DKFSTPTYTLDLAEMLPPLWENTNARGVFHLSNGGQCSWREYGQWALDCCAAAGISLRTRTLEALSLADMKQFVARRPAHSALDTRKYQRLTGRKPRMWQDAVREYVREHVTLG
ncbi:MAG: sugar nucleotide-binding protein, partial [Chthoniobacterales bacterium]